MLKIAPIDFRTILYFYDNIIYLLLTIEAIVFLTVYWTFKLKSSPLVLICLYGVSVFCYNVRVPCGGGDCSVCEQV